MTIEDLQEYVWRRLGPGKWFAGRQTVRDLVQLSVENWEGEYMALAKGDEQRRIVGLAILSDVKRMHAALGEYDEQQYGFIWAFLLSSIASAVIQAVIKWWLESHANRTEILKWQAELKA